MTRDLLLVVVIDLVVLGAFNFVFTNAFARFHFDLSTKFVQKTNWAAKPTIESSSVLLPPSVLKTITSEKLSVADVISSVKSLASTNVKNINYSHILFPYLLRWLPLLDQSSTADLIWALPKLGYRLSHDDHRELCLELIQKLCRFKNLKPKEVVSSLGGMSRLNLKWWDFSDDTKENLMNIMISVVSSLNQIEIGNMLHSLSKLRIPWSAVPPSLQSQLFVQLRSHCDTFSPTPGAMSVYSLGVIDLEYDQIDDETRVSIFKLTSRILREVAAEKKGSQMCQQTNNLIYGLAKLGLKLGESLYLEYFLV